MSPNRISAEFGRSLANGTIAHSLDVEARRTLGPIWPYPVCLEADFRDFDPAQTFVQVEQPVRMPTREQPDNWSVRRLVLPVTDVVDWPRAEATVAALAGCHAMMSLELYGTRSGAEFYLGAPAVAISFVEDTWRAAYPDLAIVEASDPALHIPEGALALVDLYSPAPYHRRLRPRPTISLWRHLLPLCTGLTDGEILFAQFLFIPARAGWHRNISGIVEAERSLGARAPLGRTASGSLKDLSEPLFAVALRLGSTNTALEDRLAALAGNFTIDGVSFRCRTFSHYERAIGNDATLRMVRDRSSHVVGQLLSSTELSVFVHLPDLQAGKHVRVSFVEGLPVPTRLLEPGLPLGVYMGRGVTVPVYQPLDQLNPSTWFPGASRKGKSTAIINKLSYLARHGHGVGLIDPHRTTAFELIRVLDDVPPERVMFLNFDDAKPVAFNPFDHPDEESYGRLTTEYVHTFRHLLDAGSFHRMMHILGMVIYALFVLKENLASLPLLLSKGREGNILRHQAVRSSRNADVQRFWRDEFPTRGPESFSPILNRLSPLLLDDQTRRTFSQRDNRVDIGAAMNDGKVVVVAPPGSIEAASLVGGMLTAQVQHAAFRRAGTAHASRRFHLAIDEFHRFISSAKTLQSIIDEAGKGGLSVSLANQETGQIPDDLLKAILSIPNICVFGVNWLDAKLLSSIFNGTVRPETLASLPTGAVYARIGQEFVSYQSPPPPSCTDPDVAQRIIAASQQYYADPTTEGPTPSPQRGPRIIDTLQEEDEQ